MVKARTPEHSCRYSKSIPPSNGTSMPDQDEGGLIKDLTSPDEEGSNTKKHDSGISYGSMQLSNERRTEPDEAPPEPCQFVEQGFQHLYAKDCKSCRQIPQVRSPSRAQG